MKKLLLASFLIASAFTLKAQDDSQKSPANNPNAPEI